MGNEDLRARLREQPPPVRYDVARGLARHQALLDAGTPLPEWAQGLPARRASWLRRVALWGGALALLTVLWVRNTKEPVAQHAPTPTPTLEQLPALPRSRVTAQPIVVSSAREAHATPSEPPPPVVLAPAPAIHGRTATARTRSPTREQPRASDAQGGVPSESEDVSPAARSARVVAPQDNLELAQLVQAERALSREPVRALRLAREGELAFRNGYFAQERHYIEVMALFALGRLGEAHAQAAAFLRDYPKAPYRRKVELELLRQPQH